MFPKIVITDLAHLLYKSMGINNTTSIATVLQWHCRKVGLHCLLQKPLLPTITTQMQQTTK